MRSITIATMAMLAAILAASAASAAEIDENFTRDRALAQKKLSTSQRQHCLKDFSQKIKSTAQVKTQGSFSFNDYISRDVYQNLYWQGADRGVAFTVPVRLKDTVRGEVATNLACYYAVNGDRLVFQYSQQVAWRL
jgi:hypothetical protein